MRMLVVSNSFNFNLFLLRQSFVFWYIMQVTPLTYLRDIVTPASSCGSRLGLPAVQTSIELTKTRLKFHKTCLLIGPSLSCDNTQ